MALRTLRQRLRFSCVLFLVLAFVVYLGTLASRSWKAYSWQTAGRGWKGEVFEPSAELGFRMLPGARGAETLAVGPDVAACIDRDGFRVPADADETAPRAHPLVLALGCSFTYGAACKAEETFAFRVAERLHGSCLNAGVCSYGLAQMLVLARKLIPKYAPEYVLFQHSPWLVTRGCARYAPTYFGLVPTPTFVAQGGTIGLRPPLFEPRVFDLPLERYAHTERGVFGFLSFGGRVGLPLFLHDDVQSLRLALTTADDEPLDEARIVASVHAEVEQLCTASHSRLVYVVVGPGCPPLAVPLEIRRSGRDVADASAALCASLPEIPGDGPVEQSQAYFRRYGHWAGEPPELIDPHPNAAAHAVIANTILETIGRSR